jgi:hypothetical protein
MALAKYYEDIVEQRRENGATIVFEYQYLQENVRRVVNVGRAAPATEPPHLTLGDRLRLRVFAIKLNSDPQRVGRELLSQTAQWSAAHFEELGRRSPEALARLAMAYRDEIKRAA